MRKHHLGVLLIFTLWACSAINDTDGYKVVGSDDGDTDSDTDADTDTDSDTDADTDTDSDTDADTDTVVETVVSTVNITSGSGAVDSETVMGWISLGGVLPAGSSESENYKARLGMGPVAGQ